MSSRLRSAGPQGARPHETPRNLSDLCVFTLRLADDALILGQRLSEWCSNAPFLEEELALANTALDCLGRARFLYTRAGKLEGKGRDEDDFAFARGPESFTNLLMCELPRGDFAFTMVRQFLFDSFDVIYLRALGRSADDALAGIAAKALKEADYHSRRSHTWMLRLGQGTEESHRRAQLAVDALAPYSGEMFEMDVLEVRLLTAEIAPDRAVLKTPWQVRLSETLTEAGLSWPQSCEQEPCEQIAGGRAGRHTPHLEALLDEMQALTREMPGLRW